MCYSNDNGDGDLFGLPIDCPSVGLLYINLAVPSISMCVRLYVLITGKGDVDDRDRAQRRSMMIVKRAGPVKRAVNMSVSSTTTTATSSIRALVR